MRCVCLVVLLSVGLATAQPAPKTEPKSLPPEAKKAVEEASAEIRKVRDRLIDTLQEQLEAATKKGNLDSALAIRAEIDRLKKADATAVGGLAEEKGMPELRKQLVGGTWKLAIAGNAYTAEWEFQEDGTLVIKDSNGKSETKWSLETKGKTQTLVINLEAPHAIQFPLPQPGKRLQGIKPGTKERVEIAKQ